MTNAECDARWLPADEDRWEAYLTDDEPPELVLYCPACAEREFGVDLNQRHRRSKTEQLPQAASELLLRRL